MYRIYDRAFFEQDAVSLSRSLLGKLIVRTAGEQSLVLRITETEAYMGAPDLASHSRNGRMTRRNQIMFQGPGLVYMFLIYGVYYCFNITANEPGKHEAVLIRAGTPVAGLKQMIENRSLGPSPKSSAQRIKEIASGPGKLCQALGLDLTQYGLDLTDPSRDELYIADDGFAVREEDIIEDARIGIDYAGKDKDRPWRFYLKDEPTVSLTRDQRLRREARRINAKKEERSER